MIHRILEIRLPSSTFLFFFENRFLMPRSKCCEHPTKHANSARLPKGIMTVSEQLSTFLLSRYNMTEIQIRWLCPRCHASESKEMMSHQAVQMTDNEVSTDDDDENDAMMIEVADRCTTNDDDDDDDDAEELNDDDDDDAEELNDDDDDDAEELNDDDDDDAEELNDDEEDNVQMDSGFLNESKENDDDSLDMDEKSTDSESMDEEDSASYEEEYQKHKAMERLSAVFKLLEIEPIHDKYVVNLLRIFINDSYV
jgi:hypothetical protein